MGPIIFIFAVGALIIASIVLSVRAEKKRCEALSALAARLGLSFNPAKDRGLADRFKFLDALSCGSNRYAFNIISGQHDGHSVMVFEYHYETHSRDSKGHRKTHHHYFSFFILLLSRGFPELKVTREGLLSKLAQAVGFDDIDFESHEFSRLFCVRSQDKKFAYDVCNGRMMEYLLENRDLSIEIENEALALRFGFRLKPEQIEFNLQRLIKVRALLPDYLFTEN